MALATLLGATSPAGVPRALAAYEGLRRDRTARPAGLAGGKAPAGTARAAS